MTAHLMTAPPAAATPSGTEALRRLPVVLNGAAGALLEQPDAAENLHELFRLAGLEPEFVPLDAGSLPERVRQAVEMARDTGGMVVVAGGDGTVACAAAALSGTDIVLGVLPFGTMNLLAKDVGLPIGSPAEAIRVLAEGAPRRVDVGEVNGQVFLCASMLGLPTKLARHREAGRRRRLPPWQLWPGFIRAALRGMVRYAPLRVVMTLDHGPAMRLRVPSLTITVNRLDDDSGRLFGRSDLDGGMLAVYAIRRLQVRDVVRLGWRLMTGRWKRDAAVDETVAREVELHASGETIRVMNDGEGTLLEPPLLYRVRPGALRVMAPRVPDSTGETAA